MNLPAQSAGSSRGRAPGERRPGRPASAEPGVADGPGTSRPSLVEYRDVPCRETAAACAEGFANACGESFSGSTPSAIQRRAATASGASNWSSAGFTCNPVNASPAPRRRGAPQNAPAQPSRPQLTMTRIRQEFVHTPFAKPGLNLQPVGNRTLVTLPVFFEVEWPATGYKPDQVRAVTLLGPGADQAAVPLAHLSLR